MLDERFIPGDLGAIFLLWLERDTAALSPQESDSSKGRPGMERLWAIAVLGGIQNVCSPTGAEAALGGIGGSAKKTDPYSIQSVENPNRGHPTEHIFSDNEKANIFGASPSHRIPCLFSLHAHGAGRSGAERRWALEDATRALRPVFIISICNKSKLRASNPRAIAYFRFNKYFESSNLPGAGQHLSRLSS